MRLFSEIFPDLKIVFIPIMKIFLKVSNFICSLGCALTYITLSKDLWMVAATYGFVSAFGQNIALIPTLTTAMKWFPNRKGKCILYRDL